MRGVGRRDNDHPLPGCNRVGLSRSGLRTSRRNDHEVMDTYLVIVSALSLGLSSARFRVHLTLQSWLNPHLTRTSAHSVPCVNGRANNLKSSDPRGSGGSNPSASATLDQRQRWT
jgi:hypothetical protein